MSLVIVALGLAVLCLGYLGFRQQERAVLANDGQSNSAATAQSDWLGWGRGIYNTLRVLVLETGDEAPDNWYLFWARFAALALFVYAGQGVDHHRIPQSCLERNFRCLD